MKSILFLAAISSVTLTLSAHGSEEELVPDITLKQVETQSVKDMSLEEIDQKLNNPLTSLWSLTLQENYSILEGDNIDGKTSANTLFFQPALPIPFGDDMVFIARPVFPLVTSPILRPDGSTKSHKNGFGDMQLFALLGPDKSDGLVWGVGGTFVFPTASDDILGSGKWQAGPAAMVFNMGEKWTTGFVLQHWWSFAGDSDRRDQNHTDFQYVIRRKIPGAMSIGMGPTISIDWEADSGNQVTLPIALGITKTIRIGKMPFKLRFEPQYALIKPDDIGSRWNFRIQITPVIPSPFKR